MVKYDMTTVKDGLVLKVSFGSENIIPSPQISKLNAVTQSIIGHKLTGPELYGVVAIYLNVHTWTGLAVPPSITGLEYKIWKVENSTVMLQLINSITNEIGIDFIYSKTVKEIWDARRECYFNNDNTSTTI